jgi:phage-related protein
MMANPWLLLIAAVIALVVIIVKNWDKITGFLKKTWEWIKSTAKATWEWIKNAVKTAVDFIVNLFMNWTLPGLIMKHWGKIKEGVRGVADFIKGIWNGVIDWFKALPGRIASATTGLWDGIKNAFRSAINWLIDKWNGFRLSVTIPTNTLTSLLGVAGKGFSIDTPNIPRLHSGGTFKAPPGRREGLALLEDGETVTEAGRSSRSSDIVNVYVTVNAGIGTDPYAVGRGIVEILQRYEKVNGAIPITVRAG